MADDITQDVFLQAFRHVTSFRGEASVKTWLLKITRNTSYNYRKSAFFRKVLLVGAVTSKEYNRSAEQSFLEKEATHEVWKQVFNLPTKFREVLVLHAKYHLPLSEIAQILKIPKGTVKSRLFGARKKLSILLKLKFSHCFSASSRIFLKLAITCDNSESFKIGKRLMFAPAILYLFK